ncbi:MAG: BON domain-containing protein [Desulfobulbaceae bacterium]|nr:BON domain-containing protein [Desulfobulbaceae bacterium]MDY0351881.1 BON domain-containing protein [Desulfobulbaceae bacterium]
MLNRSRCLVAAVAVSLLSLLLVSCYTPAGRSAGEVVDDATITTQVKTALLANKVLEGISISVKTFSGEVTLTGAVDTREQIDKAEEIAFSVRGVEKVNNLITLKEQ